MTPIHLIDEFYGVVISNDAYDIKVDEIATPYLQYWRGDKDIIINLPFGQWEYIGTSDGLTEEQWAGIVEQVFSFGNVRRYKDYEFIDSAFYSSKESGESLLKSKSITERIAIIKKLK